MSLSFPSNPEINDIYSYGNRTWLWNGISWIVQADGVTFLTADEKKWWQYSAAMLDPNACSIKKLTSGTVPTGETWLVWSAWKTKIAGSEIGFIRRVTPGDPPLVLPEGTAYDATFTYDGGTNGAAIAYQKFNAALLASNAGYIDDPKGLFYERVALAHSGPVHQVSILATDSSEHTTNLPTNTGIIITSSWVHDVAWNALHDGIQSNAILIPEVSDSAPWRDASPHLLGINTSVIPKFACRGCGQGEGVAGLTYTMAS